MDKRHRPVCNSSRGSRLVVVFCLFAFLGYFDLPLPPLLQPAMAPVTVPVGLVGVTLPDLSKYGVSDIPYPDPYTCPVCEYSPELQDVLISTLAIGPTCSVFMQPFSFDGSRLKIACPNPVSEPRAPPIAL